VAFGFVNFTMCTSDDLVGGAAKTVVWLATMCYIDNCCNCFINCLAIFFCDETTIPSACGPDRCLVLSSIERGASGNISYNKSE
jgi:hypothetical protein